MADKTDYYRGALLAAVSGGAALPQPAQFYLALSRADPGSDLAGLDEPPTGDGYARQPITLAAGVGGVLENDAQIRFGPAVNTAWGSITHSVIMDAASGGNGWVVDALVAPRTVQIGDPLDFPAGNVTWDER